jgi:hypothetical protein
MAERSTQKFARTKNNPSEKTFSSTLKTGSSPSKLHLSGPDKFNDKFNDEFILALAQSYENRRAAQAFEWESIRRGGAFLREV